MTKQKIIKDVFKKMTNNYTICIECKQKSDWFDYVFCCRNCHDNFSKSINCKDLYYDNNPFLKLKP